MSKIIKEYWSFIENSELKPYHLGQIIDFEQESKNLKKSTEDDFDYDYIGNEQFLWIISIKNNMVVRIIYRKNFPIPNFVFWDNHHDIIQKSLSQTNKLVDEDYMEDRMVIISRDGFVNLIILQKGREEQD